MLDAGTLYGAYVAFDGRILLYLLVSSLLLGAASAIASRKLDTWQKMVPFGLVVAFLTLVCLLLLLHFVIDYPAFKIHSVFELP